MKLPYIRSFSYHYREKFGLSVGKLPLDLGHSCPNRSHGGCIFCAAPAFSPGYLQAKGDINSQIFKGKELFLKKRFKKYFAYFQQETATAQPSSKLLPIFEMVLADPDCVGLILSTRPDYIAEQLLERLAALLARVGKDCLIEIGLQSAHDKSLEFLNRNHSYDDFVQACQTIRGYKEFEIGAHLLFGIPGETQADMLSSVNEVVNFGVDAFKFHHLQILRTTRLAELYEQDKVMPMTLDDYLDLLMKIIPMVPESTVIHRLWATAHPNMLIAPCWQILTAELSETLRRRMVKRNVRQGCHCSS